MIILKTILIFLLIFKGSSQSIHQHSDSHDLCKTLLHFLKMPFLMCAMYMNDLL
ncbi:hypothetical protein ABWED_1755 [Acinetobacter lwoffii]|nr:hypothetical protein ABWED_1755 [Acinetobacter lwoffii]